MQITYQELVSELENLGRELKRHKDEDLSHKDKIAVSDLLAETVHMIRRKYEITTMGLLAVPVAILTRYHRRFARTVADA